MIGRILTTGAAVALLTTLASFPGHADQAKILGKYGDWRAYSYADKAGKVCYIASQPRNSLDAPKRRGETYLSVTHRPKDKSFDVVSITAGFTFKKGAPAEVDIGGNKFELFTEGDTAWTRTDKAVVEAMMKAKTLIMHGTPEKGNTTSDTYSLSGFSQAHADIDKACPEK